MAKTKTQKSCIWLNRNIIAFILKSDNTNADSKYECFSKKISVVYYSVYIHQVPTVY